MGIRKTGEIELSRKEIYVPDTLAEVLQIKKRRPDAVVWAGGTHMLQQNAPEADSGPRPPVLAIHGVRELRRLVRSDTHVDIGACVPIGRLLEVGERFLPVIIMETIAGIGPPPLQNTATLGGAVCCPDCILPPVLALRIMDTRIEIRRHGNSRWIPLTSFRRETNLDPSEIVTRIRIPNRQWPFRLSRTFGRPYPPGGESLAVMAVAAVDRQIITNLRFAAVYRSRHLLRNRELEAAFVGKRLPLNDRDGRELEAAIAQDPVVRETFTPLATHRTVHVITRFIERIKPV